MTRTLLSIGAVARACGISKQSVHGLLGRKELTAVKIGGIVRVPQAEVDRLIEPGLRDNDEGPAPTR